MVKLLLLASAVVFCLLFSACVKDRYGEKAHTLARQSYSYDRFRVYYDTLWQGIRDYGALHFDPDPARFADSIFRSNLFGLFDTGFDTVLFRTQYCERVDDENSEFYRIIEDELFIQGWVDSKPRPIPAILRADDSMLAYDANDSVIYSSQFGGIYYRFDLYRRRANGSLTQLRRGIYGVSHSYEEYLRLLAKGD